MKSLTTLTLASLILAFVFITSCSKEKSPSGPGNDTYSISGKVLESSTGLSGVSVHLTGAGKNTTATTDSTGFYAFTGLPNGAYTLTPSKSGYTFTPPNQTVTVNNANVTATDIAAMKSFSLTGRVLESGAGISGVSVRLTGAGLDMTDVTGSTGAYTFTGIPNGTYTLTPFKSGYVFTPPNQTATVMNANTTAPDIIATQSTIPPPHDVQGIPFLSITGDTFQMGQSGVAEPVHSVTVSSFEMSETEITNAQYCAYLNAALVSGDITATSSIVTGKKGSFSGQDYIYLSDTHHDVINRCWITYSNNVFSVITGKEKWPVVSVTWYGSKVFALFYGLDLPTEAEWEYACRGGKQYEYGTYDGTIGSTKANYFWGDGYIGHPLNVKSYPKNPFGLYDMSGNVWEWCADWYGSYSSGSVTNPVGALSGSYHVLRGGSWSFSGYYCRSANRSSYSPPDGRYTDIGFRVVRPVSPQNY